MGQLEYFTFEDFFEYFSQIQINWQDGGMEAIWVELAERLLQEKPTERSEISK